MMIQLFFHNDVIPPWVKTQDIWPTKYILEVHKTFLSG